MVLYPISQNISSALVSIDKANVLLLVTVLQSQRFQTKWTFHADDFYLHLYKAAIPMSVTVHMKHIRPGKNCHHHAMPP